MDRLMHRFTLALAFLAVCMWMYACLEATQTTNPSSVDVSVEEGSTGVETGDPPAAPGSQECRLELEPPSPLQIDAGQNLSVKVITKDENGVEVPTENISVSIGDSDVATLAQIDGRFVMFAGASVGTTTAIISTACAQTAVIINVVAIA